MNKTSMIISFLFGCILCSTVIRADDLPSYYPPAFRMSGTLERLDLQSGVAVIGDMNMRLSDNVHVYTLSSRFSSVHTLHPGMKVGISISPRGGEMLLITDIWVLPDDYSLHPAGRHN